MLEGERVSSGGPRAAACETSLTLSTLREEHVAVQVLVDAGSVPLASITVDVEGQGLRFSRFVQHYVAVERRSATGEARYSLGFTEAARPADADMLGRLPDALIPVDRAPAWAPYPLAISPSSSGALYLEAFVPPSAQPGLSRFVVRVRSDGVELAALTLDVDVVDVALPYRATRAFTFYDRGTLEAFFDDPDDVERRLVQLLHGHHLETIRQITTPADAEAFSGALSGEWFTATAGYRGPGVGVPHSLLPIGAYGTLGPPDAARLPDIGAIAARAPATVRDVFVYAVDEQCDSPAAGAWRELLRRGELHDRVKVGHTCHEPAAGQDADVVMVPAQAFDPEDAARARAAGKRVWIYNGQLPFASPVVLDVPLTALTVNGWVGALFELDRWFYWESIFWEDKNRGGQGPRDVFASAETFHNADGDTSLYDGLLVYPQRQRRFPAHDMQRDGVLPSLRLKALRRGLEDAGLLALAAQVDAARAAEIGRSIVGAVLDEVGPRSPLSIETRPAALHRARGELRAMVRSDDARPRSDPASAAAALASLRAIRQAERRASGAGQQPGEEAYALIGGLFGLLVVAGGAVALAARPRRRRAPQPR